MTTKTAAKPAQSKHAVKLVTKPHEKMRIAGKLVDADSQVEVRNPYTGEVRQPQGNAVAGNVELYGMGAPLDMLNIQNQGLCVHRLPSVNRNQKAISGGAAVQGACVPGLHPYPAIGSKEGVHRQERGMGQGSKPTQFLHVSRSQYQQPQAASDVQQCGDDSQEQRPVDALPEGGKVGKWVVWGFVRLKFAHGRAHVAIMRVHFQSPR